MFCGQVQTGKFDKLSEKEANEKATLGCRCSDACAYRARETQKTEAKVYIQELFVDVSEGWVSVDDERIIKLMENAVDLIAENKIRSVSMNIPGVGTAKISMNSKDGIVIDRKKTDSESLTASR